MGISGSPGRRGGPWGPPRGTGGLPPGSPGETRPPLLGRHPLPEGPDAQNSPCARSLRGIRPVNHMRSACAWRGDGCGQGRGHPALGQAS